MQQDTFLCVLTMQRTTPAATALGTFADTITPEPGMSRADIFSLAIARLTRLRPELTEGAVLFFSLDKNQF
ncbi:hypothetical protein [Streptomyces sp. NRRL WC-3742]|uniref:hypothetical protein n=1 Tax=Streptomyces sp. NRRL WC-3742 TaxID=1463934 RepID=UPI0004C5E337|nr:hypothetical protein [Streptomyces sp. NRRL WC-3742]